jgi:hypothetical protein
MDLLIPAYGIVKPFFLCVSEDRLDLWTYVGFSYALIEKGHEHDSRNLFNQRLVTRIAFRQRVGVAD